MCHKKTSYCSVNTKSIYNLVFYGSNYIVIIVNDINTLFSFVGCVLKCQHRFVDLLQHQRLDPRIVRYINEARLYGLYGVPFISLDHCIG